MGNLKLKEVLRSRLTYSAENLPDVPDVGFALRVTTAAATTTANGSGSCVLMFDTVEQRDSWTALLKSDQVRSHHQLLLSILQSTARLRPHVEALCVGARLREGGGGSSLV